MAIEGDLLLTYSHSDAVSNAHSSGGLADPFLANRIKEIKCITGIIGHGRVDTTERRSLKTQ